MCDAPSDKDKGVSLQDKTPVPSSIEINKKGFKQVDSNSVFLRDSLEIRWYAEEDSSVVFGDGNTARKEYYQLFGMGENNRMKPRGTKVNFLDLYCGKYSQVDIVKNQFKVIEPCNSKIPTIIIEEEKPNTYYLSFFKDTLVFKKEIVASFYFSKEKLTLKALQKYNGRYTHFWLKDLSTEKIDEKFLAIGSAKGKNVFEFHFPTIPQPSSPYFTFEEFVSTGEIDLVNEKCP